MKHKGIVKLKGVVKHKDSMRPRRVAELVKRELARLISNELDDPALRQVTITAADISPDLKSAKVFFVTLNSADNIELVGCLLNKNSGRLRHLLMQRVNLRNVPKLKFIYDESLDRGARIESILDRVLDNSAVLETDTKKSG